MSQESLELHNLIQRRAIEAIAGVESMMRNPFTLEQVRKQVEDLNKESGLD
jgi:hypothetical protein